MIPALEEIFYSFNEQQQNAVMHDQGPLIVLAGPGSGKTLTLTGRIAAILEQHKAEKFKILVLTFSRKAADELRDRIEKILGWDATERLFIGTYHAWCLDVLQAYGHYIGLNNDFTIYENDLDFIELLREAATQQVNRELADPAQQEMVLIPQYANPNILEATIQKYYYAFTQLKKRLIYPENLEETGKSYSPEFKFLFQLYNDTLQANSILDFNDLIYFTLKLFREHPYLLKRYQQIYRYIMVDEGQDTTKNQFELLKLLTSNGYQNIFLVADEDQLIYEWNDAKFEYLAELQKMHQAPVIQLFLNYRCPPEIINLANQLIVHNKRRLQNKVPGLSVVQDQPDDLIHIQALTDIDEEIQWVSEKLKSLKQSTAIIARNRSILDKFAEYFDEHRIEYYKTYSTTRFNQAAFDVLIDIYYALANEDDSIHIKSICRSLDLDWNALLVDVPDEQTKLARLICLIRNKRPKLADLLTQSQNNKSSLIETDHLKSILIELDPQMDWEQEETVQDWAYLQEMVKLYNRDNFDGFSINDFLSHLALTPKPFTSKGVALLTGHGAKGLEFDHVFIVSFNQGIWPDFRAEQMNSKLEEERRNTFVAITRARKKLFLSYTRYKETRFGRMAHQPSQFLGEMGVIKF